MAASIVDEQVDRPSLVAQRGGERGDRRERREVQVPERHRGGRMALANRRHGGLALAPVAHGQHNLGTGRGEPGRQAEAHAVAAAGHHGELSGQVGNGDVGLLAGHGLLLTTGKVIASIAQGLHLSLDERDHLFRLAGHQPPAKGAPGDHISPGLLRIFDRLADTPAEIVGELGETLRQTPLAVALTGDLTRFTGPARSIGYRWFTDPACRALYHPDEHALHSRVFASGLRQTVALRGPGSWADHLKDLLLVASEEFRTVWAEHEVGIRYRDVKRFLHPELGVLELECQTLIDPDQSHYLLVYTATPGSETQEKLRLLSVIGTQQLSGNVHSPA